MALAPREIEQEARRILRRLLAPETCLVPEGRDFRMLRRGAPVKGRPGRAKAAFVQAFFERGWLAKSAGRFHLSEAGALFLRRAGGEDSIRAQHQLLASRDISAADGKIETVSVNLGESPLGWLLRRKGADGRPLIGEEEYAAGERLREDYTRAQLTPRITSDWTRPINDRPRASYGGQDLTDNALAARKRVRAALDAVGPGLAEPLVAVCCRLEGMETVEAAFAWPRRAGKIVLKIALERLARHYGILCGAARPALLRAWRAEGETEKT